ncbi:MAG: SdrD B-like domain-containing protein [Thauera sp.]|nr:SdrD B-like domain-containing protein [Thauera sp.]
MKVAGSKARPGRGAALVRGVRRLAQASALMGLSAGAFAADILINPYVTPTDGLARGEFIYTIEVRNMHASSNATAVTLSVIPPDGAIFKSFGAVGSTPAPTCVLPEADAVLSAASPIQCSALGGITANNTQTNVYELKVVLPTVGVHGIEASTTSVPTDTNTTNNDNEQASATTTTAADLKLEVAGPIDSVVAGAKFNFTLTASNLGPLALVAGDKQTVVFTVPTGTYVASRPTGTDWSCEPSSGYPLQGNGTNKVTCSRTGALAVGDAASVITVPTVANVSGGSGVALTAEVSASNAGGSAIADGNVNNNVSTASVDVTAGSDLRITKARSPSSGNILIGEEVEFTLQPIWQGGDKPGGTITVTDTLPGGLSYVEHTSGNGWTCNWDSGTLTCTRSDGATLDAPPPQNLPSIKLKAKADAAITVANTASIAALGDGALPDPDTDNTSNSVSVTYDDEADLRLQKTAPPYGLLVDQAFSFTLNVTNLGPLAISAGKQILVEDVIPANMTVTGQPTGTNWSCTSSTGVFPLVGDGTSSKLSCTYTSNGMNKDASRSISVPAKLTAEGTVTNGAGNTACVSFVSGGLAYVDKISTNNCAQNTYTATHTPGANPGDPVVGADLEVVSKIADKATVKSGEPLTYTILIRNNGPETAANVVLTDTLDSLLSSKGVASANWTTSGSTNGNCTGTGAGTSKTITCNLGSLENGATATVSMVAYPIHATGANRTNTAEVYSSTGDPDRSNNSKISDATMVEAVAELAITKTPSPNPAVAGQNLRYTVAITNNGPSNAATVQMKDILPPETEAVFVGFVSGHGSSGNGGNCNQNGREITCQWASIAPGSSSGTRTVVYDIRPLSRSDKNYTGKVIRNDVAAWTATQNAAGVSGETAKVTAFTEVPLEPPVVDIDVQKSDIFDASKRDPVSLGGLVRYRITVKNLGPSYATNVVMVDEFPGAEAASRTALFSWQDGLTMDGPVAGVCTEQPAVGDTDGRLVCRWPGLESGQSVTVEYEMRAETVLGVGAVSGAGTNSATVTIDEDETEYDNNTKHENTTTNRVSVATDLGVSKTVASPVGNVPRGGQITWNIVVTNNGPAVSQPAQLSDILAAGLTFVSATDGCVNTGGTVVCTVPGLAVNGTAAFTLTANVASNFAGSVVRNKAVIDALGDTNPGNNESEAELPIRVDPPPPTLASVSGKVYHDRNDNGLPESGEEGIPGVTITLWDNAGNKVATTTTDANGNYSFTNLQPGTYRITEDQPAGWIDGKERVGSHGGSSPENDVFTGIVLKGGDAAVNYDFGELKSGEASIAGCVYHDANDNGIRDPGEAGIPGVLITLTDADGNERTTVTNAEGCYEFTGLTPGVTYTVTETQPDGWKDGKDTAGTVFDNQEEAANDRFVVTPGEDEHGKQWNFGELKPAEGELVVVKTLYEGRDNGASCGNPEIAKKQLLIVEKVPTTHKLTWCFSVTNTGKEYLGEPVWDDNSYPGMVATRLTPAALPLAPGETGMWYFEAEHERSVRNVVSVEMPVTDPDGKLVPGVPPASSSDEAEATFGMIYDPPFGVKVGKQEGFDLINWTMVWVNDNLIAANNVLVSDVIKAPMDYAGSLVCVGEGVTTVIGCDYDVATKTVFARANFGADFGKTVANASNRLFISFKVKVPSGTTKVENQGDATWTPTDEDGNELGEELDNKTDHVTDLDIGPIDPLKPEVPTVRPPPGIDPNDPDGPLGHPDLDGGEVPVETPVEIRPPVTTDVTPVPVDNPLALLLLAIGVAGVAARAQRRRRSN